MIYIIRHGQTDWNLSRRLQGHNSVPLNETGRQEAEKARKKINSLKIDKIISSDLLRARQTAEIVNKDLCKNLFLDSRLRSVNYGMLDGRYIPEISKEEWAIYNSTPEKFAAESVESVFWRIKSFFDEQFSRKENVLVVAHGGTLRILSYYLSNRDTFIREVYESKYKDAKQATNTALFEINPNLTFMKPIYY